MQAEVGFVVEAVLDEGGPLRGTNPPPERKDPRPIQNNWRITGKLQRRKASQQQSRQP